MFDTFDLFISSHPHTLISLGSCALACILASPYPCLCVLACILASLHPHIFRFICPCLHPCMLISFGSCVFASILASSHPDILTFICVSLYPRILTSSYPQVHVCLLVYLHPHILIPLGSLRLLVSLDPHILVSSSLCMLASMLTSSGQCVLDRNE